MHALRLPALAALPPPTLLALPTEEPQTPTIGDLWSRIEKLVQPAISAPTAGEFFTVSRDRVARFNNFMTSLAELLSEEDDILTVEGLALQIAAAGDRDLSEAIAASSRAVRWGLVIRDRLFGARQLDELRDEGGPLHMFASYVVWHAWTLVCCVVALRQRHRLVPEVGAILTKVMLETGRGAYIVLRGAEISQERAHRTERRIPPSDDGELTELEREAELHADENLGALRERVRRLVEEGRVPEARRIVAAGGEGLSDWASVLEPPRVIGRRPARGRDDFDANVRWLRANADRFPGQWLALADGQLLGADASRLALHRKLESEGKLGSALFVKMDELSPWSVNG